MATCGDSSQGSSTLSLERTSGRVIIVCDFCRKHNNKDIAAVVTCVSCKERLCSSCRDVHKLTSATIGHVLQTSVHVSTGRQFVFKKAKLSHSVCVKTQMDRLDCGISGVCVLPDSRLAAVDFTNKCIKILDMVSCQVTDRLYLQGKPVDVTMVSSDLLAVTMLDERYVQLVDSTSGLSLGKRLALPSYYNSVVHSRGQLFLVCCDPPSVHICDMSGKLLQRIEKDEKRNQLFTGNLSRLAISPDQSSIYVTDCEKHEVVYLRCGVVKARYTNDRLKYPIGVAVDDQRGVYVCSGEDSSIHRLDAGCSQGKVLLNRREGILAAVTRRLLGSSDCPLLPCAIAYSDGRLYVTSSLSNNLQVYTLYP